MREKGDRLSRQRGKGSFSGPAWGGREGGAEGRRGNVPSKLAAVLRTSVPFLLQYHQAMLAAASWKGRAKGVPPALRATTYPPSAVVQACPGPSLPSSSIVSGSTFPLPSLPSTFSAAGSSFTSPPSLPPASLKSDSVLQCLFFRAKVIRRRSVFR